MIENSVEQGMNRLEGNIVVTMGQVNNAIEERIYNCIETMNSIREASRGLMTTVEREAIVSAISYMQELDKICDNMHQLAIRITGSE